MRPLPVELIEQYESISPNLIFLVELNWPGGTVRCHTGLGDLLLVGEKWSGVGDLGTLGEVTDDNELGRSEVTMTLTGFNQDLLAETYRRDAVGREGVIYAAVLNEKGGPVSSSFTPIFAGFIYDISAKQGETNAINVTLATDSATPQTRRPARYTDESHRREYPDDYFYRFAAQTSERPIYWGSKRDAIPYKKD